jgi:hypothetical protein
VTVLLVKAFVVKTRGPFVEIPGKFRWLRINRSDALGVRHPAIRYQLRKGWHENVPE